MKQDIRPSNRWIGPPLLAWIVSFLSVAAGRATAAENAEPRRVVFDKVNTEYKWSLKELSPDLPSDWTDYNFLVLEMRASSSERFQLEIFTKDAMVAKRIQPFQNTWVRASIPLAFYRKPARDGSDLAATYNKHRDSYWININFGGSAPIGEVEAIGVQMEGPIGRPTLEIRSVKLAKDDPGDAVLEPKIVVDEFGQWIPADWPGKAKSLDDLKKAWADEDASLKPGAFDYDKYGGYLHTEAKATGFFRVEQINGRWWFVDPEGHLFYSTGVNGIGTSSGTPVANRREIFASLPPVQPGRGPGGGLASFYTRNLQSRYGEDFNAAWSKLTFRRLDAWGFNTVAGFGGNPRSAVAKDGARKPYTIMLRGQIGANIMGMPDVYSPDFEQRIDQVAQRCEALKDDPYLLGYFVGNEPPWPTRETLLCDAILAGPDSAIKSRLTEFLKAGDTPERRKQFVYDAFDHFLAIINAAIKKHDPNHLNLGIRLGGEVPDEVIKACRVFDVCSINIYKFAIPQETLDRYAALTGRPLIGGEFHFGAPERGLGGGLRQVANQTERGVAYQYYVEHAASHPSMIGMHWFQWIDQPSTGRNDGENYNIGFVDVTDRPYLDMIGAIVRTHQRLYEVHAGKIPPTDRLPEGCSSAEILRDVHSGKLASKPLYRDPPFDAPTDPVLCFNTEQKKWFMYYTARRATATNAPGVTWIHGSNIGMAESSDGGATWTYRGTADINYGKDSHPNDYTYWAPEVIWHNGTYHMYLSFVPGIFTDWNHPREIVHLTSKDGIKWDTVGKVDLKSDRTIDACVIQLPNGTWRMWYKDERKPRPLSYADSPDLYKWEAKGTAVTDFSGEGPKVIHWKGKYWLIADCWANGMRVWSSDDCLDWKLQDEALFGSHGDVVISGDRAWWFYFGGPRSARGRTTAINVVELSVINGRLIPGDPDQPTYIDLKPAREEEK